MTHLSVINGGQEKATISELYEKSGVTRETFPSKELYDIAEKHKSLRYGILDLYQDACVVYLRLKENNPKMLDRFIVGQVRVIMERSYVY